MAAFDTTRTAYGSVVAASRVSSFFLGLGASIIAWNDTRSTRNSLSSLTDRELDDIGLVRGDIDEVGNPVFIR